MIRKYFVLGLFALSVLGALVLAQSGSPNDPNVGKQLATVCCEQTVTGAFCQNVPSTECKQGSRQVPTSCESTSYCKAGTCYDSTEGTCLDNTPQLVCNNNGGVWSEETPPQCSLGCCILGDQAAFVSLVRCKRLSSYLGLETNYDTSTANEISCIEKVQQQEVGACVYEFEFERTCKFGTRSECNTQTGNASLVGGTFYAGKLCSAEELGTICGPTTKTTCVSGKDGVYFVDSCGNPANIYDSSKVNDKLYWSNIISRENSCNPSATNALSSSCGNCDYLQGSICRGEKDAGKSPTYGDFICADLNCKKTQNKKDYKHGESWCVYEDYGSFGKSDNSVGSRFYKHVCINGEEVLEQCEDFRAEECISDTVNGFSQAACKVNRWQDCLNQEDQLKCENEDLRDCNWKEGIFLQALANQTNGQQSTGTCFPENKPGFDFWSDTETSEICSVASETCVVKFEKGLFGGEKCVGNCQCLEPNWEKEKAEICKMVGDCGPSLNWIGNKGYDKGYKITIGSDK
ncbi:MAG: hypothetical protein AABW89_04840 [Nanoarchaeota archaeon]